MGISVTSAVVGSVTVNPPSEAIISIYDPVVGVPW